ncbi:pilus assembly protein [Opitutaceae bacterium EW11]|nr:pilus assembly protein [Opitutaceae bacterium EW11]
MKLNTRSTKGFTLVEIMIVVVIIGLLAAMAIPAFQKVRKNSIGKAMANDARQIAGACQQVVLENPSVGNSISITYTSTTGAITSTNNIVEQYLQKISKGYTSNTITYNVVANTGSTAFALSHPQIAGVDVGGTSNAVGGAVNFDTEGKVL